MSIDPEALAGHTITGVSSSWHELDGRRSPEPVHVWLTLAELGTLRLHTLSGLVITLGDVDDPADMGMYGRLVVESNALPPLNERVGERIQRVSRLVQSPPGMTTGMVLHFRNGAVGVADLGDELIVTAWPAPDWSRWGVSIDEQD